MYAPSCPKVLLGKDLINAANEPRVISAIRGGSDRIGELRRQPRTDSHDV